MKYEVFIFETGPDWMERVEVLEASASSLTGAIALAQKSGYRVIPNNDGGCSEFVQGHEGKEDYFSITVFPEARG